MLTPTICARLAEATVLECSEETKNALKAAKTAIAEQKEKMVAAVAGISTLI